MWPPRWSCAVPDGPTVLNLAGYKCDPACLQKVLMWRNTDFENQWIIDVLAKHVTGCKKKHVTSLECQKVVNHMQYWDCSNGSKFANGFLPNDNLLLENLTREHIKIYVNVTSRWEKLHHQGISLEIVLAWSNYLNSLEENLENIVIGDYSKLPHPYSWLHYYWWDEETKIIRRNSTEQPAFFYQPGRVTQPLAGV